jgi:hypothetical protein
MGPHDPLLSTVRALLLQVVVGAGDPNPLVAAAGIATLQSAGIEVALMDGAENQRAKDINTEFLARMEEEAAIGARPNRGVVGTGKGRQAHGKACVARTQAVTFFAMFCDPSLCRACCPPYQCRDGAPSGSGQVQGGGWGATQ